MAYSLFGLGLSSILMPICDGVISKKPEFLDSKFHNFVIYLSLSTLISMFIVVGMEMFTNKGYLVFAIAIIGMSFLLTAICTLLKKLGEHIGNKM